jgi:hypothetical protein
MTAWLVRLRMEDLGCGKVLVSLMPAPCHVYAKCSEEDGEGDVEDVCLRTRLRRVAVTSVVCKTE